MLMTEMKTHLFYCRALFYLCAAFVLLSHSHCRGRRRSKPNSSFRTFRLLLFFSCIALAFVIDFNWWLEAGMLHYASIACSDETNLKDDRMDGRSNVENAYSRTDEYTILNGFGMSI